MDVDLTRADVVGTFAGLRPLIAPSDGSTVKASREHRVTVESDGVVRIGGGKYTTYRVMARDVIDAVLGPAEAQARDRATRPSAGSWVRPSAPALARIADELATIPAMRRGRTGGRAPAGRPARDGGAGRGRAGRRARPAPPTRRRAARSSRRRSPGPSATSSPFARRRPGPPDAPRPGAARSRRRDRAAGGRDPGRRAGLGEPRARRSRSTIVPGLGAPRVLGRRRPTRRACPGGRRRPARGAATGSGRRRRASPTGSVIGVIGRRILATCRISTTCSAHSSMGSTRRGSRSRSARPSGRARWPSPGVRLARGGPTPSGADRRPSSPSLLAVGLPLTWYVASPSVIRTELIEPAPIADVEPTAPPHPSATAVPASPATGGERTARLPRRAAADTAPRHPTPVPARPSSPGPFSGTDDFHFGRGTASIVETAPGPTSSASTTSLCATVRTCSSTCRPDADGYVEGRARTRPAQGHRRRVRLRAARPAPILPTSRARSSGASSSRTCSPSLR